MIGIPLGLLYGNVSEWAIHKYVLHEKGKNKKHFFFFIGMCTKNARKNQNRDWDYREPLLQWHAPMKEINLRCQHFYAPAPLAVAPFFTATVFYCSWITGNTKRPILIPSGPKPI